MESPSKLSTNSLQSHLPANGKLTQPEASEDKTLLSHPQTMGRRGETDSTAVARHATDGNINVVECLADLPPTEEEIIFSELSLRNRFPIHTVSEERPNEEELNYYQMSIVDSLEDSILSDARTQAYNDITEQWLRENHPELVDEFSMGSLSIA